MEEDKSLLLTLVSRDQSKEEGFVFFHGARMFSTHFVDQTSSLDHNNITKLWPLDGSFGQSGGRQYLFLGPKILEESETTKERCKLS